MGKLRVGILGATGMVGQQFIRLLENHPYFETSLLMASEHSIGMKYENATDWIVSDRVPEEICSFELVHSSVETALENEIDFVFSALPGGIASEIESDFAEFGIPVFSNASAHRMRENVPILIPDINPEHLDLVHNQEYDDAFIVTNSNCTTSGLVFGLKPLMSFGIKHVTVSTYQAISGAGRRGVASLDILGNVIPYISGEEEKIESETRKILGVAEDNRISPAKFQVTASCARVPVVNGHLESVVVELEKKFSIDEIKDEFSNFSGEPQELELPTAPAKPIIVHLEDDRPQPTRDLIIDSKDVGMGIQIGRLRKSGRRLSFFLLVHNTIRGAAGASMLNAEFAQAKEVL